LFLAILNLKLEIFFMSLFKKSKKIADFEIDNPLSYSRRNQGMGEAEEPEKDPAALNRWVAWLIMAGVFMLLFGRVFYLQVIAGEYYREIANENRIQTKVIPALRGGIQDREGVDLVQNLPGFDAVVIPALLPKEETELRRSVEGFSKMLELSQEELWQQVKQYKPYDQNMHLVQEAISEEKALEIAEKDGSFPGFEVANFTKRYYPRGPAYAHILGYEGKINQEELGLNPSYLLADNIGKSGLEYTYEQYLRGKHGVYRFEVNAQGQLKKELGEEPPVPGSDIVLHLDSKLQDMIYQELSLVMEENPDATGATAIAIDPRNGGIRAMVSVPSFDNNLFSGGISQEDYDKLLYNPKRPLFNRAVSGEYPPGSTLKPMVALAALNEGTVNENLTLQCKGGIKVGEWEFPDWKTHGPTDIKKAIAESCDVYFYAIGGGWGDIPALGIDRINDYSERYGFGEVQGIDLPGERAGLVPNDAWKQRRFGESWYVGDSYHVSIGQGYFLATPLQVANMTAAVANGGTLYRPQLVDKIVNSETGQEKQLSPVVLGKEIVSSEAMRIVREGMRDTVTTKQGSAWPLKELKVTSAGKTGTAQFGNEEKTHSWYTSFAPYEEPELAMVVLIESGGGGFDWAVPVTKNIYRWYFDYNKGTFAPEEPIEDLEPIESREGLREPLDAIPPAAIDSRREGEELME
jgi:penicillin-binding protein 2